MVLRVRLLVPVFVRVKNIGTCRACQVWRQTSRPPVVPPHAHACRLFRDTSILRYILFGYLFAQRGVLWPDCRIVCLHTFCLRFPLVLLQRRCFTPFTLYHQVRTAIKGGVASPFSPKAVDGGAAPSRLRVQVFHESCGSSLPAGCMVRSYPVYARFVFVHIGVVRGRLRLCDVMLDG